MYKLVIKPLAEVDAKESVGWYNEKREGLGDDFLLILDAKMNSILRNPHQFQFVYKNIRRALIERFPYCIFFIVENNMIYVLAIQHTSRNPILWKNRK